MTLIDLNQVTIANLMVHVRMNGGVIDQDMIRHMVVNSLRSYRTQFFKEYGELVICTDAKNVWRKQSFPQYKANRKKSRKDDVHDWREIFNTMTLLREELQDTFPYKTIHVDTAEADDVIATIIMYEREVKKNTEKIMIVSGDKDFVQLQRFPDVYQVSPTNKKDISDPNPHQKLKEHIIRGDRGDGIPNIMTDDDVFVSERRQKRIFTKKVEEWVTQDPEEFCDAYMLRNYRRNEKLIDLTKIPEDLQSTIIDQYNREPHGGRDKLLTYFMENRMRNMVESIHEF